jgi:hypothetical protein
MIGRRILAVPSDSSNWPGQLSCGFASFEGSGHHWACPRTRSTLLAQMALGAGAGAVRAYGVRRSLLRHLFALPLGHPRGNLRDLNFLPIGATSLTSTSCLGPAIGQGGGERGGVESEGSPTSRVPTRAPHTSRKGASPAARDGTIGTGLAPCRLPLGAPRAPRAPPKTPNELQGATQRPRSLHPCPTATPKF